MEASPLHLRLFDFLSKLKPFTLGALVFGISHNFCSIHPSRFSPNATSFNKNIHYHLELIEFTSTFNFFNCFNC